VRQSAYVYLEVEVAKGESVEAACANGDDDAVFSRFRGALDALPGASNS
jgi:hypothetical protein